jgi:quercetin dioxygenase-like cupin family protein|tara:strand:- start:245 stop:571 length:327 start_codon:yes stop_codon:yes gene_type:complete
MFFGHVNNQMAETPVEGATRKELSKGEHIQVFWLEIKAGTEAPEHSHPNEQAGYVLRGNFEALIGEEKAILEEGHFFRIPGNISHSGIFHEDTVMIEIYSPPKSMDST